MTARRGLTLAIAVALAAILLFYSLRGIDWRQVGRIIARASPLLLAVSTLLSSINLLLRALRWRVLLNSRLHVGVSEAFWATMAGYFGNNFLPARAGELVRSYMIGAHRGETGFALTVALAERVADALALVSIAAVVLLIHPAQTGWMASAARPIAVAALAATAVIAVVPLMRGTAVRVLAYLPLPERVRSHAERALDQVLLGLGSFHDGRRLAIFIALVAAIWTIDAVATVVGAAALGLTMPLGVAFLLLAGLGLGSALPSTPGYVGIYQFAAVVVLTRFGFSRTDAIAYILVGQALSYVVIGAWGGVGIWRYRRATSQRPLASQPPST